MRYLKLIIICFLVAIIISCKKENKKIRSSIKEVSTKISITDTLINRN